MKVYTLSEIEDEFIGQKGTPERDKYEEEYELFFIGETIKRAREKRKLSRERLGEMCGFKTAQISRIENGHNLSFEKVFKIFRAMGLVPRLHLEEASPTTV